MTTQTQKNFKKKMRELEQELKQNKNNDKGFYSYIERDHIKSYYQKRDKKKILTSISIGGLLIFVFIALFLASWVQPVADFQDINSNEAFLVSPKKPSSFMENKQKKIAEYLDSIRLNKKEYYEIMSYRSNYFASAVLKGENKEDYFINIEVNVKRLENIIKELGDVKPPKEMENCHKILKENFCIGSVILSNTLEIKDMSQPKEINKRIKKISTLVNKINENNSIMMNGYEEVFKELGMRYEKIDNQIRYWYNE